MTLNAKPIYATSVNSRSEPYLQVCHVSSDGRHWRWRNDEHLLCRRGGDHSSWHKRRKLSRPIVRPMLCLLRGTLCLLGDRTLLCLLGDRTLLCLLLAHITLRPVRVNTALCLLLRCITPGLVSISPTLCLLKSCATLCLLKSCATLCLLKSCATLCLLKSCTTLCLLRTLTNGSLIRLGTSLCWLGRLRPTTLLATRLNIGCSSGLTTRVSR